MLDFCRAERLDFILGVASTSTLRRHVAALEQSTAARFAAAPIADKLRRYKEFYDGAASWRRVERIIARVEAGAQGTDTRFVVTNLPGGSARTIYEGPARGDRRRTTSKPGNGTSPPIARPAPVPRPTNCACSCTSAPIGSCGRCAA